MACPTFRLACPILAGAAGRSLKCVGRGERIRTSGPCLPKTVLYQAELLPDRCARPRISPSRGRRGPASIRSGRGEFKPRTADHSRSEEHTSELQSRQYLVCRLLLEKKKHQ